MKQFLEALSIVIALIAIWMIVFFMTLFIVKCAKGQEDLSGKLLIDFKEESAAYTEVTEFPDNVVKTTVTVLKSECQSCIEQVNLKDCQDLFKICKDVQ